MLFTGEHYYHLDAKNRLVIPGKIRDRIDVTVDGQGWYLVPGFDGTLSLYTPATFELLAGQQQAELFRLKNIRDYDRLHFALSAHVETDRLGRILVPEPMLRRSGIGKDVAIIGVRDHLEIWDQARWEQFVGGNFGAYDEMARDAFDTAQQEGRRPPSQ
ncbi:MAG: hypothetical protein GWP05_09335 [Anaerolineaceae bacterium]|nr:hypothetical protein [Anaerolineaceae bacterium]